MEQEQEIEIEEYYQKLIKLFEKELEAYAELKDVNEEKHDILKKATSDDLVILDNKILSLNNQIEKLKDTRTDMCLELTGKYCNMMQLIEFTERNAPEFAKQLDEIRVKSEKLTKEIALLNNQNKRDVVRRIKEKSWGRGNTKI